MRWTAAGEGVVAGRPPSLASSSSRTLRGGPPPWTWWPARYVDADGAASVVSSCGVYEFDDGQVAAITSYAVELDAQA